ncbi:MAG: ATP-dependent DNA ligase [Candidatus Lokiarchaeota archaeon]|nr:ATP-dependent DNA ligase [Candidatus Lokiarchaeota archaeon]
MEKTSKRLEIMSIFQEIFTRDDLVEGNKEHVHDKIVYLCQGKLYPDFLGRPELQMAQELAKRAIAQATGFSPKTVSDLLKKSGDLGNTFGLLKQKGTQSMLVSHGKDLSVLDVHAALVQIAGMSGADSQTKKVRALAGLLGRCSPVEAKYVGRFVDGKMRLGANDLTMIEAIARLRTSGEGRGADGLDAETLKADQAANRAVIERAYNIYPDLGLVIKTALLDGIDALKRFQPQINIPIRSMLAQRLDTLEEFPAKHGGSFACEYKLDGERMQVHKRGDEVALFSRRQEIITSQFPDVVDSIRRFIVAKEIILDGEVVAVDRGTGRLMPFQILMQRRRKHGIEEKSEEVPTRVYLFDVLFLEGKSMLDAPYLERRAAMEGAIAHAPPQGKVVPVPQRIVSTLDELTAYFNQAIKDGTEGLLTKSIKPESVYQPGARGWLWIKLKSLRRGKLPDSMDLVVVGANMGEGRRARQYGTLLVAARNEDTGTFDVVTRVSSGMDDEKAEWFLKNLHEIPQPPPHVRSGETPDKWVEPSIVLEIIGDEITDSSSTIVDFSIRFPRIIRIRDDKSPDDTTTVGEILAMRGGGDA